jgi:flagellin-specific chaperone FliS
MLAIYLIPMKPDLIHDLYSYMVEQLFHGSHQNRL